MSRLGDLIHLERTRRNMTAKQVARLCSLSEKYLLDVEQGRAHHCGRPGAPHPQAHWPGAADGGGFFSGRYRGDGGFAYRRAHAAAAAGGGQAPPGRLAACRGQRARRASGWTRWRPCCARCRLQRRLADCGPSHARRCGRKNRGRPRGQGAVFSRAGRQHGAAFVSSRTICCWSFPRTAPSTGR